MVNYKKTFWIIFAIFIVSRIFFLNSYCWFDECGWGQEIKDLDSLAHTPTNIPHMPLGMWVYKASTSVFGLNNQGLRMVPLIFGILQLLLIYKFCKNYYNIKTALIAMGIYTVSFWVFISNVMVDIDGSVLSFLTLLVMYLFYKLDDPDVSLFIYPTIGILLALMSMTRLLSGFIMFGILLIYSLFIIYKEKSDRKDISVSLLLIGLSFIFIFVLMFGILLYNNFSFYWNLLLHSFTVAGRSYSLRQIMLFGYAFLIFMVMFIVPFFKKTTYSKKNLPLIIFIFVYVFLIAGKTLDPGRYLMVCIPFLVIILSDYLTSIPEKARSFLKGGIPQFILFWAFNIIAVKYIYNGLPGYLKNWYVMEGAFIIVGSSFRPFYLSNVIFFILCGILIINLIISFKKIELTRYLIFGFFITFNIFMVTAYPLQNDISNVGTAMIKYSKNNLDLNKTFYVDYPNFEAVQFYLDANAVKMPEVNSFTKGNDYNKLSQSLNSSNIYIYIINYFHDSEKFNNKVYNNCVLLFNGVGQIYECR